MASHQKKIGEFLIEWKNDKEMNPEFHIFHYHGSEKDSNLYKYCIPANDFKCRKCDLKPPAGVLYFGKTRRLSEDEES